MHGRGRRRTRRPLERRALGHHTAIVAHATTVSHGPEGEPFPIHLRAGCLPPPLAALGPTSRVIHSPVDNSLTRGPYVCPGRLPAVLTHPERQRPPQGHTAPVFGPLVAYARPGCRPLRVGLGLAVEVSRSEPWRRGSSGQAGGTSALAPIPPPLPDLGGAGEHDQPEHDPGDGPEAHGGRTRPERSTCDHGAVSVSRAHS